MNACNAQDHTPQPWPPYHLSDDERALCAAMAHTLADNERAIQSIADSRGWRPETIRNLALEGSLGMHDGKLVYLYSTGAKKRFKPLRPALEPAHDGARFIWMFGKPDSPWRSQCIQPGTRTVHITEGETAAISLVEVGIDNGSTEIAIAVPGATSWRDAWAPLFSGKYAAIWPDPDEAGRKLKERIHKSVWPHAACVGAVGADSLEENS